MPTVGQCPPGKKRPRASRYGASSAPPCTAGDAVAMPVASSYESSRMAPRSMTSASVRTDHCAQLWPPERTATCQPLSTGQQDRGHHLGLVGGPHHRCGFARGQPTVEDPVDAGVLEAGVPTKQHQAGH